MRKSIRHVAERSRNVAKSMRNVAESLRGLARSWVAQAGFGKVFEIVYFRNAANLTYTVCDIGDITGKR